MFKDAAQNKYRPIDILQKLAAISSVPVISGYDQFIGTGTIGGYMYSTEQQAEDAAQIGLRILRGEAASSIPVKKNQSNRFIFDHIALQRFDISLSDLPPDSIIKNQQYSFWELYQPQIITAITTIAFLLLIVIFLLGVTRQLNRAHHALAHLNINLEKQVQERTVDLQKSNARLERLSNIDGLTNIHNRRYFDSSLKYEWKRHNRSQSPISMILCDIDFFKKYNDTYGHLAGDACLKQVAKAIQKSSNRPSDVVARYGGEEFALILPETDLEGAVTLAKEIKRAIDNLKIEHTTSLVKPIISMSFGIATVVPAPNQEPEILISLSDSALYQSKEKGRDKIQQINFVK
jgi:diguanylate cyclase (GGDEF)-like protein